MRIAIVWDWNTPTEDILNTWDGPLATYNEIAKATPTQLFTGSHNGFCSEFKKGNLLVTQTNSLVKEINQFKPDYIFCWGSFDRPWHQILQEQYPEIRKGIRFSGGDKLHRASEWFDTIFCESQWDIDQFKGHGINHTRLATACDTTVFKPLPYHSKVFQAIYPTSYCAHKRIQLFADTFGKEGVVCGRQNEVDLVTHCRARGAHALGRVSSETLSHLYNMSRFAVCTASPYGGGERMVLEAMACNVAPVVMADHEKPQHYIKESGFGIIAEPTNLNRLKELEAYAYEGNGRDYVLTHFTPQKFADAILEEACKEPVRG